MNKILVFGHKNPDTDTICSALAVQNMFSDNIEACRLGEISDETKYVLDYLNISAPKHIESIDDNQEVILVDHNEFGQSVNNIENANILKVIDHHRINNFKTDVPLYMNVQPVGCTATILYEIAQHNNYEITKQTAVLLISAIVSDTLLFKSPTCTEKDVEVCNKLQQIAEIDVESFGLEMLKAGTDLSKYSASHLMTIDTKEFVTTNGKFKVSQVTTMDIDSVKNQFKDDLLNEMNKDVANDIDLAIFVITDILECDSLAFVVGNDDMINFFNKNFSVTLDDNEVFLKDVVSRKKQIVPYL